jgi:putative ABC transport system permease protein
MPQDSAVKEVSMGNAFKFAFRNVLRNKKRSILTATSIFFGSIVVAFAIGLVNGMVDNYVSNTVDYQTGDLKVTTKRYVRYERFMPVDETMTGADRLMLKIRQIPGVDKVYERIRFMLLLGKDEDSVPAMGIGADLNSPELNLKDKIYKGSLESIGLYMGYELAEKLHVKIGDRILIASFNTAEGGVGGIKMQVKGLLNFDIGVFNRQLFFIDMGNARKLLKMYGQDSEIYIYAKRGASIKYLEHRIRLILPPDLTVRNPSEQVGGIYDLMIMVKYIYYFFVLLILMLASFVVISTIMQAVFERIREIGTLKAMGMADGEIFIDFTLEGAIIGAIGGIPGATLGYLMVIITGITGIRIDQFKLVDMPFNFVIYPSMGPEVFFFTIAAAIIMSSAAAMLPAKTAGKLTAAEALRKL